MKTLHRSCAGLEVHKAEVVACVRIVVRGKVGHEVRRFATTTRRLMELAEWLEGAGVTHAAMEATGVYWKPVWHNLEGRLSLPTATNNNGRHDGDDQRRDAEPFFHGYPAFADSDREKNQAVRSPAIGMTDPAPPPAARM